MITEFQKKAVLVSLKEMFAGHCFDICTFDACKKILGVFVPKNEYEALHALHCVHWSEMPEGFPQEVMAKTLELLSGESMDLTELTILERKLIIESESDDPKPPSFMQKLLGKN